MPWECSPAALLAFDDLDHNDAIAVLFKTPNPTDATRLSIAQIRSVLKRGGRRRNLDTRAAGIQKALRQPQLSATPAITAAFATSTRALTQTIDQLNTQITELETELSTYFGDHPDSVIYCSLPGLGQILGARVLSEFGDDAERYTNAKSRRNYAGTSPLTVPSGRKHSVVAKYVRNKRLYDAIDNWALCSLRNSPGCKEFYDQRKTLGDLHHQALRALGNRLVGYLHGCLKTGTPYNENTAWAHRKPPQTKQAA